MKAVSVNQAQRWKREKKDIGEKGKGGGHQVNGVANMVSQEYKR